MDKMRGFLKSAISQEIFPGCALGVFSETQIEFICEGCLRYDSDAPEVSVKTVYDVASITKAIPTSMLALYLVEKKVISPENRLIDFVPGYNGNYRDEITVWHLLTHTLDFKFRLSALADHSADIILDTILHAQLGSRPGTVYHYANATSILLGLLLESATGKKLETLASEIFFKPLNMNSTSFSPDIRSSIAPTEIVNGGVVIQGIVHDESARALLIKHKVGSAGLFSTVEDLSVFMKMIISNGCCGNNQFFSEATIAKFSINQLDPVLNHQTGLGWELNQSSYMGTRHSGRTFGKTGFTGCVIVADYHKRKGFVFLTNHTWPHRFADRQAINRIRAGIADMVFSSL